MPFKTPPKKLPNAKPRAEATPDQHRTKSAITPVAQNNEGLPGGWRWVKLEYTTGRDGVFCDGDWVESKDQDKNGDVRLIQLADVGDGYFRDKSDRYLTLNRAKELNCTFLEHGDILLARMPDPLGRCCLFPLKGKNKYVTVVDVCIIRTDSAIVDKKLLTYTINSPQIRKSINDLESGTTRKRISRKNLNTIDFPLPPLPEQHAIVSKIEELLSELDKGKQQLETAQQQLKIYRQAVLKWAFEGKLTNKNAKEGELPQGWKWVKTIDVIETINNGYTPTKEFLSQDSGEIPFIKVYNLNFDGTLNFKKNPTYIPDAVHRKDLKRSICYPGDVLINIVGPPLGKVSIVTNQFPEWNINQAIVLFRPNERVLSKYLAYFLQNSVTVNWLENTSKATAGQWNIKVSTCREIPFPFCSIEEQYRIIQEIESRLSVCDKVEETITTSLAQAETLRQSILKKAFEGKLV
jgi:type I restriction enzyme S subunit